LQINKVDEKICSLLLQRDTSAALANAAVPTNSEDTDDDYFAFTDSADTEASQAASDTTNNSVTWKCCSFWMIARRI